MRAMDSTHPGWQRFSEADWAGAREAFSEALEEDPGDPDALDGLGQALWWMGERDAGIERRREAYNAYRRRDDARNAGRLATYLAGEHRIDGERAAAAGWLARARRLLADAPPGPEAGWLAIEEAKRASDPIAAEAHARAVSTSPTRPATPTSNAWHWPSSAGPWCARGASTRASACSTRR
jgi:tetratricopeptide (TPR) repeat protein